MIYLLILFGLSTDSQITQIILGKGFIHDLRRFARLSLFWCRFAFVNL